MTEFRLANSSSPLKLAALVLLAVVALGTRLPAPWRMEVVNDEMYHLESWRNRYRTDNMLPLLLRRLETSSKFTSQQKEVIRKIYFSSPLVQRLLFIKSEYATLGFGTMAEVIEALSRSNLVALRIPSVLFALGSILLAYRLGKALWDDALGFWIATLVTIGLLPQVYAGIGRAHGMTQFFLFAVLYVFVQERRRDTPTPRRLFLMALLAQTAHITGWAVIGLVIISELLRRYAAGTPLGALVRQTWWYAALSVLYLGLIAVSSINTSIASANMYFPGADTLWRNFCIASPFGHLGAFGEAGLWVSGLLWAGLIGVGVFTLFFWRGGPADFRWTFLVVLAVSLAVPFFASPGVRHLMIYGVMPTIMAAIGARSLLRARTASLVGVIAVLAAFAPLSFASGDRAYTLVFPLEERFSKVANELGRVLKPGDIWMSYPYFLAYPLYPYRPDLPEPITPLSLEEYEDALRHRPPDHSCFILTINFLEDASPLLKGAIHRASFRNATVLLELPPRSDPISKGSESEAKPKSEQAAARSEAP